MRLLSIAVVLCLASACAQAQESAPFYRGKTIRVVISTGVAGGYAEYARVIAEHMGRHIAGNPGFIVQSMPGAGGLQAANYLFTQAPQDGTTIGSCIRACRSRRSGAARACASTRSSSTGS